MTSSPDIAELTASQPFREFKRRLEQESDLREVVCRCPLCNTNIQDRRVTIYEELIMALYRVYCWCGKNRVHEFRTKQIRHLLDRNNYARFGDLVRFGGIVYKPKSEGKSKKGLLGINMKRAKEFFAGERSIPLQIQLNQITNEIEDSRPVRRNELPGLADLLRKDGLYDDHQNLIKNNGGRF